MGLALDLTDFVGCAGDYEIHGYNEIFKREREDKPMKKSLRERMYEENAELSEKIVKIKQFRESEAFDYLSQEDRDLLIAQENAMVTYHEILSIRYRKLKGEYK